MVQQKVCILQVDIGLLCDAAPVVLTWRPFIKSLIEAMSCLKAANHLTRLDQKCMADIAWWRTYIEVWNGTGLFPHFPNGPSITADASGFWGAGAFISPGFRFNGLTHGPQPIEPERSSCP